MANLNTAISPAPQITCLTKSGQVASGYTGDVTMALSENPTGATLSGDTVVSAVNGVATFSNLLLNRSGKDFRLRGTGAAQLGVTPRATTSNKFSIPTQLVFTTQPTSVGAPDDILPAFVVTVQDSVGNTDTEYESDITVSLYTGAGLGILTGLFTRAAENGVATFTGLSIDSAGTYSLRAEGAPSIIAATPSPKVSDTFQVGSYVLTAVLVGGVPPPGGDNPRYGMRVDSELGSIDPPSFNDAVIKIVETRFNEMVPFFFEFTVSGERLQDFFTSITIGENTLTAADADIFNSGVIETSWAYSVDVPSMIPDAGTYTVIII